MNKSFATYLQNQVRGISKFKNASIFVKKKQVWIDVNNKVAGEKELPQSIFKISGNDKLTRLKGSPHRVAFRLGRNTAVVVAELAATTQNATLKKHAERLENCFVSATSTYNAHHDELTGVLNRHGIKHALEDAHSSSTRVNPENDDESDRASSSSDLALFSFDIDKIKSINDGFGHDAGDVVLIEFANRLASFAKYLETSYSAKFIFGRPGGEEFDMLAIGTISKTDIALIADQVLEEIRKPLTRTEADGDKSGSSGMKKSASTSVQIPSIVTASVGIAFGRVPTLLEDLVPLYLKLRTDADAALYRAKADGRNCVRLYADILWKHGRVKDFDSSSGLLRLDIGTRVGAQRGQVYAVYSPIEADEDASPSLGKKARRHQVVASAKIIIVDADVDTSTAAIVECVNRQDVLHGSLLRLIPKGSSVISANRGWNNLALVDPSSDVFAHIDRLNAKEELGLVAFVTGKFRKGDTRAYSAKSEEFISLLRLNLPTKARIFSSYGSEIFVVIEKKLIGSTSEAEALFKKIAENFDSYGLTLFAGIYSPELHLLHFANSGKAICFYCKATRNSMVTDKEKIKLFSARTPHATIVGWRKSGESEQAIVDYQQFREYGIESPLIDNQLALSIWDGELTEYFTLAEAAFKLAIERDPTRSVFKANLALFWADQGNFAKAYPAFKDVEEYVKEEGGIYLLGFAKCVLALPEVADELSKNEIGELFLDASSLDTDGLAAQYNFWVQEIKSELRTGKYD